MSVQVKNKVTSVPHLEQVSGSEAGRVFELTAARLTIGRSSENDIVASAEGVSRVHALLVKSEGHWFIRDNNSKNGLAVNGQVMKESWLETGDLVQLGHFVFRFDAGVQVADSYEAGALPVAMDGGLEVGIAPDMMSGAPRKKSGNSRTKIYIGLILVFGLYFLFSGSPSEQTPAEGEALTSGESGLSRDFKMADKPSFQLGNPNQVPMGMEDPLLKKAEQEMSKLDWSNMSLREAEQAFRRGQREYLNRNYHRAIASFSAALELYGGHLLADRYLRRAIYEAEVQAKINMAAAVQYYESLQYARAIHHFNEVISLMAHRPTEPIVKEAGRYIKQAELRLQAAELFP